MPSFAGALLTFATLLLMITYSVYKVDNMLQRKGYKMMTTVKENFFDEHDVFTADAGFGLALTFINENAIGEPLDPAYGTLKFFVSQWGIDENEEYYNKREELPSHKCSEEELGFVEGDATQFYPVVKTALASVKELQEQFTCISREESYIYGSFDLDEGRMLELTLRRCEGEDYCASPDEIKDYFRGKYFGILMNTIRFDSTKWEEESIVKESLLSWIPIATQTQQEFPFQVARTLLNLQDKFINLDEITELEDSGMFNLKQAPSKPFEFNEIDMQAVSFQINLDMTIIDREIISVLDVLSDIGGLDGTLVLIVGLLLSILNYNAIGNYMVANLYKASESGGKVSKFKRALCCNLDEYFFDLIPSCCLCCRMSRKHQALMKAREMLDKEMDILSIVRSLRFLRKAVSLLLPDEGQREELEASCCFEIIEVQDARETKAKTKQARARDKYEEVSASGNDSSRNTSRGINNSHSELEGRKALPDSNQQSSLLVPTESARIRRVTSSKHNFGPGRVCLREGC